MNVEWELGGGLQTALPCSHPPNKAPSVNPPCTRQFFFHLKWVKIHCFQFKSVNYVPRPKLSEYN